MQNSAYLVSTVLTILAVSGFGVWASRRVKNSADFSVGSRSFSAPKVACAIIGTLVGGASTVGTAQAAYVSGVSAMWFVIGASGGSLLLGLVFAKPLREAEVTTVTEYIERHFGHRACLASSVVSSFATYIHTSGQLLSAMAILTALFGISNGLAILVSALLILSYIFLGGFLGSSAIGQAKTFLLFATLLIGGWIVLREMNGFSGFAVFSFDPWFNLFSGGIAASLAQGFSVALGICASQTYLQAVFAGRSIAQSRAGCFLAAAFTLPVGAICTMIGMFMRHAHPDIASSETLTRFILTYMNPAAGGIVIGTLIISAVSTRAGLILGIGTMLSRDIYKGCIKKDATDREELFSLRVCILILVLACVAMVSLNLDSLILQWAFLSMALRATVILMPVSVVLLSRGRIPKRAGLWAIVLAPLAAYLSSLAEAVTLDPLYVGLTASALIFASGYLIGAVQQKDSIKK